MVRTHTYYLTDLTFYEHYHCMAQLKAYGKLERFAIDRDTEMMGTDLDSI